MHVVQNQKNHLTQIGFNIAAAVIAVFKLYE